MGIFLVHHGCSSGLLGPHPPTIHYMMNGFTKKSIHYPRQVVGILGVQHGYAFTSVTGAKRYSEVRSLGRLAVTTFIIGEKVLPEIFPGWL